MIGIWSEFEIRLLAEAATRIGGRSVLPEGSETATGLKKK
jgi:hypothetical protein